MKKKRSTWAQEPAHVHRERDKETQRERETERQRERDSCFSVRCFEPGI